MTICYFTASGNCLYVARRIGGTLLSIPNTATRKAVLTWTRNASASGYQVQYSLTSSFSGAKTVTITKNATLTTTVSSLTKGKTYYTRIRAYKTVGSTKYYSNWSASRSVKISK